MAPEKSPPGPWSEEAFYNFMYGAGNHEAKLLLTGVLHTEDTFRTCSELASAANDAQGRTPVWPIISKTVAQYCQRSFVQFGIAEEGEVTASSHIMPQREDVKALAWRPYPEDREHHLAWIGFLGTWSLDHPRISVQQLWGLTASRAKVRLPRIRQALYEVMLVAAGRLSRSDLVSLHDVPARPNLSRRGLQDILVDAFSVSPSGITRSLTNLVQSGVLVKEKHAFMLSELALEPVEALTKGLIALRDDGCCADSYIDAARQILPDKRQPSKDAFAAIMSKGAIFSRAKNTAGSLALRTQILDILQHTDDALTVAQVCNLLNQTRYGQNYGQTIGYYMTHVMLAELARQEVVDKRLQTSSVHNFTHVYEYNPLPPRMNASEKL